VNLEGTVDAFWKKEQAESDTYRVKGVLGVKNSIAVAASGEITDEEIAKEIVNALKRNREIEPDNIDVTVEDNHVTLSGTVKSEDARSQIKKTATFTENVKGVQDNLVIKYPER
jgi:osmotically-inducible protein OsmY